MKAGVAALIAVIFIASGVAWLFASEIYGQEIFADNKAGVREGFPVPSYFGAKVMNPNEFADPVIEAQIQEDLANAQLALIRALEVNPWLRERRMLIPGDDL